MQLERVRKNHMDVEWHEYTDENGQILRYKCKHHRKGFHYRTCGDYVALMRYRSMESEKFHEYTGRSTWHYVYGGYWSDVH